MRVCVWCGFMWGVSVVDECVCVCGVYVGLKVRVCVVWCVCVGFVYVWGDGLFVCVFEV